jgi:HTH-type transcriptional regulator, sugar sensing transcriptional regulator
MLKPQQLEQFGLNEKEAKIYLASLEVGAASVQEIAAKAGIHRVSTYDLLESLTEKGFIRQVISGSKRIISAIEPEEVIELIRRKERKFSELVPELKAIQIRTGEEQRVLYFTGREGLARAMQDYQLYQDIRDLQIFGSNESAATLFPSELKKEQKERSKKGIKVRRLLGQTERKAELVKAFGEEVRYLSANTSFEKETIIYGNRVLIISWDKQLAMIIVDKGFSDDQRFTFELLWNNSLT